MTYFCYRLKEKHNCNGDKSSLCCSGRILNRNLKRYLTTNFYVSCIMY